MTVTPDTSYPPVGGRDLTAPVLEIRADGGQDAGFGHLGRCLAIAEEFGADAVFSVPDEIAADFVRARGAHLAGLGEPEPPLVLVDRVTPTGTAYVTALQQLGRRVILLDDLGSGRQDADLVIDPPTAAAWPPTSAPRMAGFEHVLLRREVREAQREADGTVLLAMGGSDPFDLTAPLAAALDSMPTEVVVARGPGYRGATPVGTLLASPTEFVPALARAALLVAGYGHSLLEAASLGVPAIAIVAHPDHLPHAAAFCEHQTAVLVDMRDGPRPEALTAVVHELLADSDRMSEMAQTGRRLVDGRGVERVVAAIRRLA